MTIVSLCYLFGRVTKVVDCHVVLWTPTKRMGWGRQWVELPGGQSKSGKLGKIWEPRDSPYIDFELYLKS